MKTVFTPYPLSGIGWLHLQDNRKARICYRLVVDANDFRGGGIIFGNNKFIDLAHLDIARLEVGKGRFLGLIVGTLGEEGSPVSVLGFAFGEPAPRPSTMTS